MINSYKSFKKKKNDKNDKNDNNDTVFLGTLNGSGLAVGAGTTPTFLGDELTATAAIETGLNFVFIPNPNITTSIKTTITIYGNETGGSQTIPVNVLVKVPFIRQ